MSLTWYENIKPRSKAPFAPKAKAKEMLSKFERGDALSTVLKEIQNAYDKGEFYAVSLWREVRYELEAK